MAALRQAELEVDAMKQEVAAHKYGLSANDFCNIVIINTIAIHKKVCHDEARDGQWTPVTEYARRIRPDLVATTGL